MTGTIWLLVESKSDAQIVTKLIHVHFPNVGVKYLLPSGQPSISTLDRDLADLVTLARRGQSHRPFGSNDCIVVLHDDDHSQPDRRHYTSIADKCAKYGIVEVVAKDEIEAWLLSDSGVCGWLKTRCEHCNTETRPSARLKSLMNRQKNLRYPGRLDQLLPNVTGDSHNQSFQSALIQLHYSPCVKDV